MTGGGVIVIESEAPTVEEADIEIEEDPQMASGVGPRRGRTEFDDWTLPMDDEAVLELYAMRKTR